MICIYHKVDLDGICSAAIVRKVYPECVLIGVDYWEPVVDFGTYNGVIIMVDFSYPMEVMQKMKGTLSGFVWCDHHITSLKAAKEAGFNTLGLRDEKRSGCMLIWDWLAGQGLIEKGNQRYPRGVRLLGRYDLADIDEKVLAYQYAVRSVAYNPESDIWTSIFDDNQDIYENFISDGLTIIDYVRAEVGKQLKQYSSRGVFEGYKALFMNYPNFPGLLVNPLGMDEYKDCELFLFYVRLPDGRYRVTISTNRPGIHCGKLCKRMFKEGKADSGGGHQSVGGMVWESFHI